MTIQTSIAMATYNGGKHLRQQLESLAVQTCLPDELVVCDDGSVDDTIDILEQYGREAPFPVRIHRNSSNLGFSQNFAKAIGLCRGGIIFLSDQDDFWFPDKISRINEIFSENPEIGYVFSDARLVDDNLQPLGNLLWEHVGFSGSRYEKFRKGNQVEVILEGGPFIYGNSMAFRSSFCSKILPIMSTQGFTHDSWLSLFLSATGSRGMALPEALIAYRQHDGQVVGAGRKMTASEKWDQIKRSKASYFAEKAAGLRYLVERIEDIPDAVVDPIKACIRHTETRGALSSLSGWKKFASIFEEVNSGRYARFSSSWKSAFKDFFLTG